MQPNLLAIDVIAAHCDGCSGPCSRTIRTARSRTSDTYFRGRAMGSILSRNEPFDEAGTVQLRTPRVGGRAGRAIRMLTSAIVGLKRHKTRGKR